MLTDQNSGNSCFLIFVHTRFHSSSRARNGPDESGNQRRGARKNHRERFICKSDCDARHREPRWTGSTATTSNPEPSAKSSQQTRKYRYIYRIHKKGRRPPEAKAMLLGVDANFTTRQRDAAPPESLATPDTGLRPTDRGPSLPASAKSWAPGRRATPPREAFERAIETQTRPATEALPVFTEVRTAITRASQQTERGEKPRPHGHV